MTPPLLAYPVLGKPHIPYTDASNYCVGAILNQEQEGVERAISYASKVLDKHQRNYTVSEKDCYAIIWALKKYRVYCLGRK